MKTTTWDKKKKTEQQMRFEISRQIDEVLELRDDVRNIAIRDHSFYLESIADRLHNISECLNRV